LLFSHASGGKNGKDKRMEAENARCLLTEHVPRLGAVAYSLTGTPVSFQDDVGRWNNKNWHIMSRRIHVVV
jgi:hypothetical protein